MNLIERLRGEVVCHELNKIGDSWEARRMKLVAGFNDPQRPTQAEVLALGSRLSGAFRLESAVNDRSQKSLSGGGSVWQGLICHYLNLCLAGTDAVAVSRRYVPESIKSALKVSYSSSASVHADLDVMVIYLPGLGQIAEPPRGTRQLFSRLVGERFAEASVVVVQAKTNWNDNAQIPMLWNFIYRLAASGKIPSNGFSVGSGQWHLKQLRSFAYAFVTVPTNRPETFKSTGMPVIRVANMSGGAFWGQPSRNGVMLSLQEFFAKNYNVANQNFPEPSAAGLAISHEFEARTGEIDIDAFQLVIPPLFQ